jgi:membrane protease YdiL (CAAX protease family)
MKLPGDADRGARDLRRVVMVSSLAFSVLLTAFAWLLLRLRGADLASALQLPAPASLLLGAGAGVAAGGVCLVVVRTAPLFRSVRRLAADAVAGLEPRWYHFVIVAAAAGWGEELFFRGALQPLAGIWLASVVFVILHGALRHRTRNGIAFVAFLFAASAGLGFLAEARGVVAAMVAHTTYDLTVLAGIRSLAGNR